PNMPAAPAQRRNPGQLCCAGPAQTQMRGPYWTPIGGPYPTPIDTNRNDIAYGQGMWGPGEVVPGVCTIHTAAYESPNCPEGWDTFMGYLAKTEPLVAALMDRTADACEGDDQRMVEACRAAGVEPVMVLAPAWLVREGVFEAAAYPVDLLRAY